MLLNAFIVAILLFSLVGLASWRAGIGCLILAALIQDPIRKLTPGAPPVLALATVPIWLAIVVSAIRKGDLSVMRFRSAYPRVATMVAVYLCLLVVPVILSATYSEDSWKITLLGLYAQSSMVLAIAAGAFFPRDAESIRRLLSWYCLLTAASMVGGVLERLRPGGLVLGTGAMDFEWWTARTGDIVYMVSGFFRSPDVMGWHASALTMLSLTLAIRSRGPARWLWLAMAGWGGVGLMLCARRKMIAMIPVFAVAVVFLYVRLRRARGVLPLSLGLAGAIAVGAYAYGEIGQDDGVKRFYMTTLNEATTRIHGSGPLALVETIQQAGFFGHGLGMATQGAHRVRAKRPRIWQESGPGILAAEVGVPGVVAFIALAVALAAAAFRGLRNATATDEYPLYYGLAGMVVANAVAGLYSAQILGDPFVSVFLPLLMGLVLSATRIRSVEPDPEAPGGRAGG